MNVSPHICVCLHQAPELFQQTLNGLILWSPEIPEPLVFVFFWNMKLTVSNFHDVM